MNRRGEVLECRVGAESWWRGSCFEGRGGIDVKFWKGRKVRNRRGEVLEFRVAMESTWRGSGI
jgi:hypothetical protein